MKLRLSLLGLVIAFPCLYLGGAVLDSAALALLGLLLVAAVCAGLLWPAPRE